MKKMHTIDMEHAGLLRRYLAFLIDSLICYIIIGNIAVSIIDQSKMQLIGFSIFFLYFSIEGSWLKGQSLGKKIFKIRYIALDKSPIKPKHYLLRATIIAFSFSMPFYEAAGSQIQAVSYALIILLLWMSIFIYPVFHPQNRSLLDIVNQLIIVKDMGLSHQSLMVQGPVRLANLLTMLAFIIISITAYTIFVAPINNLNSQIQEAKTVAKALSQINNRDVSVQINYPLDRNTGVKRALLLAVVHLHEDELSIYESDPKLRSPYFLNYYRRMQELNDNPQISYLQVILTTKKRFGYFYPIKYNLAGKVIPIKALSPETLVGLIKSCDLYANAFSCTNASVKFSRNNDLEKALHYATRGCELNDALGCYNAACYQCKLSHPQEALNAFKQSIDMYFSDPNEQVGPTSPEKDPDLDCIRNNQDFEKTLKRYRSAHKL